MGSKGRYIWAEGEKVLDKPRKGYYICDNLSFHLVRVKKVLDKWFGGYYIIIDLTEPVDKRGRSYYIGHTINLWKGGDGKFR